MKHTLLGLLLLGLSTAISAEPFDDLLSELNDTSIKGDSASFMSHVVWETNPEAGRYECADWAGNPSATLVRGEHNQIITKEDQRTVLYGRNGNMEVFSVSDDAGQPFFAAYFVMPSGEGYLFRVGPGQKVVRAGRHLTCKQAGNDG